jgi:hypothetical protein
MTLLPYTIFLAGCAISARLGVLIANRLWRRREVRLREEALEPFLEPIPTVEVPRPWISLGDAANSVVGAARAAQILRENTSSQPVKEAAE